MKAPRTRNLMAIVALLAALLGAVASHRRSVMRAKEAADRTLCVFFLKQIGMAIDQYAGQSGRYPPGTLPDTAFPTGRRLGWGYAILTWFEDESGADATARRSTWDDPRYSHFDAYLYRFMSCPSRDIATRPGTPRPANYAGIAGLGVDAPGLPASDRRAGLFGDDRVVGPADVADGLAGTMMVAESARPSGPWFAGGRSTVRGLDPSRQPYLGPGRQFGGIHGDGANVLMADGSVRHLMPSIAPRVFEAMSTMAGGEKVSVPWDD